MPLRITISSIPVSNQAEALAFYRDKLGFVVRHNMDLGGGALWLTLVSPADPDGPEILLEPNGDYPPMAALKSALVKDGIPYTSFEVEDIDAEVSELKARGVAFKGDIKDFPGVRYAILDDTCGNLIQIQQTTSDV